MKTTMPLKLLGASPVMLEHMCDWQILSGVMGIRKTDYAQGYAVLLVGSPALDKALSEGSLSNEDAISLLQGMTRAAVETLKGFTSGAPQEKWLDGDAPMPQGFDETPTECGAFETGTGKGCILESDHVGPHVFDGDN